MVNEDHDNLWLELEVESLGESVELDLALGEGPHGDRGGGGAGEGGGGGGEDTLGQQTGQVTSLQHGLQHKQWQYLDNTEQEIHMRKSDLRTATLHLSLKLHRNI